LLGGVERKVFQVSTKLLGLVRGQLDDSICSQVEWFVPPEKLDAGCAEDESEGSDFKEGDGEAAGEATDGCNDKDYHMNNSDEACEIVGFATLLERVDGDARWFENLLAD